MTTILRQYVTDVREKLAQDQVELALKMSRGSAGDYSVYKHECGKVWGLAKAAEILKEFLNRAEPEDADDPNLGELK